MIDLDGPLADLGHHLTGVLGVGVCVVRREALLREAAHRDGDSRWIPVPGEPELAVGVPNTLDSARDPALRALVADWRDRTLVALEAAQEALRADPYRGEDAHAAFMRQLAACSDVVEAWSAAVTLARAVIREEIGDPSVHVTIEREPAPEVIAAAGPQAAPVRKLEGVSLPAGNVWTSVLPLGIPGFEPNPPVLLVARSGGTFDADTRARLQGLAAMIGAHISGWRARRATTCRKEVLDAVRTSFERRDHSPSDRHHDYDEVTNTLTRHLAGTRVGFVTVARSKGEIEARGGSVDCHAQPLLHRAIATGQPERESAGGQYLLIVPVQAASGERPVPREVPLGALYLERSDRPFNLDEVDLLEMIAQGMTRKLCQLRRARSGGLMGSKFESSESRGGADAWERVCAAITTSLSIAACGVLSVDSGTWVTGGAPSLEALELEMLTKAARKVEGDARQVCGNYELYAIRFGNAELGRFLLVAAGRRSASWPADWTLFSRDDRTALRLLTGILAHLALLEQQRDRNYAALLSLLPMPALLANKRDGQLWVSHGNEAVDQLLGREVEPGQPLPPALNLPQTGQNDVARLGDEHLLVSAHPVAGTSDVLVLLSPISTILRLVWEGGLGRVSALGLLVGVEKQFDALLKGLEQLLQRTRAGDLTATDGDWPDSLPRPAVLLSLGAGLDPRSLTSALTREQATTAAVLDKLLAPRPHSSRTVEVLVALVRNGSLPSSVGQTLGSASRAVLDQVCDICVHAANLIHIKKFTEDLRQRLQILTVAASPPTNAHEPRPLRGVLESAELWARILRQLAAHDFQIDVARSAGDLPLSGGRLVEMVLPVFLTIAANNVASASVDPVVMIRVSAASGAVRITVSDNGEPLANPFESGTVPPMGDQMGLIAARRLARIPGGDAGFIAEPTRNTFWIEVPYTRTPNNGNAEA